MKDTSPLKHSSLEDSISGGSLSLKVSPRFQTGDLTPGSGRSSYHNRSMSHCGSGTLVNHAPSPINRSSRNLNEAMTSQPNFLIGGQSSSNNVPLSVSGAAKKVRQPPTVKPSWKDILSAREGQSSRKFNVLSHGASQPTSVLKKGTEPKESLRDKSAAFIQNLMSSAAGISSGTSPIQKLRNQLFKKKDTVEKTSPRNRVSLINMKPTPIKKIVVA